jgi:hypothetical protein
MGVQSAETAGLGHYSQIRTNGLGTAPAVLAPAIPIHNSDVTNPFYSDQEFIPAPQVMEVAPGEAEPDTAPDAPVLEQPEEVFNDVFEPIPVASGTVGDEPELVLQSEVAQKHKAAVSARFGDHIEDFPEAPEVVIDDIFGAPTTPVNTNEDSDALPFSFE